MVHQNSTTVGRLDGKLEVGGYGTVHTLQGDQYGSAHAFQEGQYRIFAPSFNFNFIHNFTSQFSSVFTPSFNPNITTNLLHHNEYNVICLSSNNLECLHQVVTHPSTNIAKACLISQISWPQDTIAVIKVDVFLPMEIFKIKLYFRYIKMTKQRYKYSDNMMDIFQLLGNHYASSRINI